MRIFLGLILCAVLVAGQVALAEKPAPLEDQTAPPPSAKPPPLGTPQAMRPMPAPGPPIPRPPATQPPSGPPASGESPFRNGSGFLVADGRILTNNHVVAGCRRMTARNARNETRMARVDATDPRRDLALLGVAAGFGPPLVFRSSPAVERGESVITYGFPLSGLLSSGPSLTTGSVSALSGLGDNPMHFQISAPVQPGNSGGPLLDAQAHVIGVVVSKLNASKIAARNDGDIPQNVNFAIKGYEALAFLTENNVTPETATSSGPDRRASETGEVAHPATVFIECYK